MFLSLLCNIKITVMKKEDIINAYCRIRTIDQTIPDDILDFMKDAAIEKLEQILKRKI